MSNTPFAKKQAVRRPSPSPTTTQYICSKTRRPGVERCVEMTAPRRHPWAAFGRHQATAWSERMGGKVRDWRRDGHGFSMPSVEKIAHIVDGPKLRKTSQAETSRRQLGRSGSMFQAHSRSKFTRTVEAVARRVAGCGLALWQILGVKTDQSRLFPICRKLRGRSTRLLPSQTGRVGGDDLTPSQAEHHTFAPKARN